MTASDEAKKALSGAIAEMTPGRAVQFHPQYCPEAKDADVKDWDTSHDLSVIRSDGSRYKIGHFRHASDALFDQLCRNHIPALLAEIARMRGVVTQIAEQTDGVTPEPENLQMAIGSINAFASAALKGDTHE